MISPGARDRWIVILSASAAGTLLGLSARGAPGVGESSFPPLPARPAALGPTVAFAAPPDEEVDPDTFPPDAGPPPPSPVPAHPPRPAPSPTVVREGMVLVPGGALRARTVRGLRPSIASFWMDRTEVTVEAYRACVDARVCPRPERSSATCTYDLGDPQLPVSCVHWANADAYCRFVHKRLPTDLEWELAARGAGTTPYPWGGNTSCAFASTMTGVFLDARPCGKRPSPVGTHPLGASPFGVQDLIGNVEEWTADWYADHADGYAPPARAGSAHVLRGGGWLSTQATSNVTFRDWASSMEAGPNVGFRCARDDRP